jgi:16S rRNA G527 N7-methylase RsmG
MAGQGLQASDPDWFPLVGRLKTLSYNNVQTSVTRIEEFCARESKLHTYEYIPARMVNCARFLLKWTVRWDIAK